MRLTSVSEDAGGERSLHASERDSSTEVIDGRGDGGVLESQPGGSRSSVNGLVL